MDLFFLAEHYKKILIGIAAILIVFLAGYAFNNMQKSKKNDLLASKVGQLEMIVAMSGGKSQLDNYLPWQTNTRKPVII